jgi:tRNA threonylcarbamoyladenosine biosynthesis protein TsaE
MYQITLDNIEEVAKRILSDFPEKRIFAFFGEMGAGKTTFIKELCKVLKVENVVNSPTFSIINEYQLCDGDKVFHFDFYRMKNLQEIIDLGYEEYFYSGNYCFLEWSELLEDLLPQDSLKLQFTVIDDSTRELKNKN